MPNLPRFRWKAITLQKHGNRPEENEDACLPTGEGNQASGLKQFVAVIADGATQTSFSSLWANLLIKSAFARGYPTSDHLLEVTQHAQGCWNQEIAKLQLPWHAEEKVKSGSFSTLLWFGIKLTSAPIIKPSEHAGLGSHQSGRWHATAVGDSCLFHIRKGTVLTVFPITKSEEFSRDPVLLSSIPARNTCIFQNAEDLEADGEWITGDEFLLMTDALAGWFLREAEKGAAPLQSLRSHFINRPAPNNLFSQWLDGLRIERSIKNDDTTLVWIGIGSRFPGITSLP